MQDSRWRPALLVALNVLVRMPIHMLASDSLLGVLVGNLCCGVVVFDMWGCNCVIIDKLQAQVVNVNVYIPFLVPLHLNGDIEIFQTLRDQNSRAVFDLWITFPATSPLRKRLQSSLQSPNIEQLMSNEARFRFKGMMLLRLLTIPVEPGKVISTLNAKASAHTDSICTKMGRESIATHMNTSRTPIVMFVCNSNQGLKLKAPDQPCWVY